MSYELHLIRVAAGEAPLRAAHDWVDAALERELNPGPAVAEKEEEKQRLADALIRFNATLGVAEFDFGGLAASEEIDEAEARRRYRHIELNSDDYSGIQITLWDDTAELCFPYWHGGQQARDVLQQAWEYLQVLQTWGSFVTYDPQLDRILNVDADFDAVLDYLLTGSNSAYESAPHEL